MAVLLQEKGVHTNRGEVQTSQKDMVPVLKSFLISYREQSNFSQGNPGTRGEKGQKGDNSDFGTSLFSAMKRTGGTISGDIIFDEILVGEDLVDKNSGVFTSKHAGVYMFTFSSGETRTSNNMVRVKKNGSNEVVIYEENSQVNRPFNYIWSMVLEVGDKVNLHVSSGTLYTECPNSGSSCRFGPLYFHGFLIKSQ